MIALACASAVLSGCAKDDQQAELRPLSLQEHAYSVTKTDGGYAVNWAGLLVNRNRWHFGEHAVAVVTGVDAAGKEVIRVEQPLDAVPPGREIAFSGQAPARGKPVRVTIECREVSWREVPRIPSAFLRFPVSDVVTQRLPDGSHLVTGYVGHPFRKPGNVVVTALLRDASGRLIGGGTAHVDGMRHDRKRRFVITVEGVTGKVAKTDVFAGTWGTTAKPYLDLVAGGAAPVHTVTPTTKPFAKDRGYRVGNEQRP